MTRQPQRVADYLGHILQAIERIQRYTDAADQPTFMTSEIVQDAVIRNLEVIGEACRNIERSDPAFALAHPAMPLGVAYEMRNALAHGYFRVDLAVVWATIKNDLPGLHRQVNSLLKDVT